MRHCEKMFLSWLQALLLRNSIRTSYLGSNLRLHGPRRKDPGLPEQKTWMKLNSFLGKNVGKEKTSHEYFVFSHVDVPIAEIRPWVYEVGGHTYCSSHRVDTFFFAWQGNSKWKSLEIYIRSSWRWSVF